MCCHVTKVYIIILWRGQCAGHSLSTEIFLELVHCVFGEFFGEGQLYCSRTFRSQVLIIKVDVPLDGCSYCGNRQIFQK